MIIIVNYRCAQLTVNCLRSLLESIEGDSQIRVSVVENGSQDDSIEVITSFLQVNDPNHCIDLIESKDNLGFAGGNNIALRHHVKEHNWPDKVVLLNPDTEVQGKAINLLEEFLRNHPNVGVAGGMSLNADDTPQNCCFRFPSVLGEFARYANVGLIDRLLNNRISRMPIFDKPQRVDWVSGAFLMFRRELLEEVGLLDEGFFLYYEETDLLRRASNAGWECWHVPHAQIVHFVGQSSGVKEQQSLPPDYWFQSRCRYFRLNHGWWYERLSIVAAASGLLVSNMRFLVGQNPSAVTPVSAFEFAKSALKNTAKTDDREITL